MFGLWIAFPGGGVFPGGAYFVCGSPFMCGEGLVLRWNSRGKTEVEESERRHACQIRKEGAQKRSGGDSRFRRILLEIKEIRVPGELAQWKAAILVDVQGGGKSSRLLIVPHKSKGGGGVFYYDFSGKSGVTCHCHERVSNRGNRGLLEGSRHYTCWGELGPPS